MADETDELKSLADLFERDPRSGRFSYDPRGPDLTNHHAMVAQLRLPDFVPIDIRTQFATACNLLLYSWFVYRFIHVAELHAIATLELALRDRLGDQPHKARGLSDRLQYALDRGLLKDVGLRSYQRMIEARARTQEEESRWPDGFRELFGSATPHEGDLDRQRLARRACRFLPRLRNLFAHGTPALFPQGLAHVETCADLITQLYSSPEASPTA